MYYILYYNIPLGIYKEAQGLLEQGVTIFNLHCVYVHMYLHAYANLYLAKNNIQGRRLSCFNSTYFYLPRYNHVY